MPRPSLRPDPAGRLLPPAGRLRAGARPRQLAAARRSGWSRSTPTPTAPRPPPSRPRPRRCRPTSTRSSRSTCDAAFEKELAKFPDDQRDRRCEAAFDTPADKRTAEQKKLVAANPKLNITPGVLYQYDQKAADELKKRCRRRSTPSGPRSRSRTSSRVLDEVPGQVPATQLFHRGDYRQPKGAVAAGRPDHRRAGRQAVRDRAEGREAADHRPPARLRQAPDRAASTRCSAACW